MEVWAFGSAEPTCDDGIQNQGEDLDNGGWSYSHGPTVATTTTAYLSVDEDQIGDSERSHTTEQVGANIFETPLVYP